MRNVTVSVPDEVYRRARIKAAEQGTSLSSLVTEFLSGLTGEAAAEFDRLLAQQDGVLAEIDDFEAADRLPRHESHERAVR